MTQENVIQQFEKDNWKIVGKILKKALVLSISLIFIAVAFQTLVPQAVMADSTRIFSMGFVEHVDSANPYVGILDASYVYYGLVYDYLLAVDEDLHGQPCLAAEWWYMDGPTAAARGTDFSQFTHNQTPSDWPLGSIWDFNLTEDVFWSDGEEFDAEDVAWTINVQIGANYATYWAYQPSTRWIDHAEVMDELTVRVFYSDLTTKYPFPAAYASFMSIPIMPEHLFSDKPPTYLAMEWNGVPAIGTGAFTGTDKLRDELNAMEVITMVKNPYYDFVEDGVRKGVGAAYNRTVEIDELQLKFFADENVIQLAAIHGDIDAGKIDSITYYALLESGNKPEALTILSMLTPTGFTRITAINDYADAAGDLNPLRLDPVVQRAMAIATNKTYIIDQFYKGLGLPGISIICTPVWPEWYWEPGNESSWFNVSDGAGGIAFSYNKPMKDVMEFDLELANEMLNASGYDEWTGGEFGDGTRIAGAMVGERMNNLFGFGTSATVGRALEFEIVTANSELVDRQVAKYHELEWRNIGVSATPEYVSDVIWSQRVYSYLFNVQLTYWSGDIDPNYLCFISTSYSLWSWNDFGVDSEEYDQIYLNQLMTFNYTERKHWVDECQKWQYLSGSIITTVMPKTCYAYSNNTWENWGDWEEHPGLAVDHFWGEAPLLYTVKYKGDAAEEKGIDLMTAMIAAGILSAIIIATVAVIFMRKRKVARLESMDEEEMEEEEKEEK